MKMVMKMMTRGDRGFAIDRARFLSRSSTADYQREDRVYQVD